MKITDVKTILLTGPSTNDPFLRETRKRRSAAFIEIYTDTELMGLGETYAGYYCPELVPPTVDFFKEILIGQSVGNISELWQRMYHCHNFWCRLGVGVVVLSGIESALWDLKGKMHGLPVYELLGGRKHEALDGYATGGPSNYPKEKLKAKIDHYLSLGFKAFKLGFGAFYGPDRFEMSAKPAAAADLEADKMDFVRQHVGKDVKVLLDAHMGNTSSPGNLWSVDTAKAVMEAVEPYDVFLFEEPLHYTDPWGYAELCQSSRVPIAGGECLTGSYEWRLYVEKDCFDIGQPDASFTGGLGEFLKVASMLESRGRRVATHSWGAGGTFMQNLHGGFACANTAILEIAPDYGPLHHEIIGDSFAMKDGKVLPPADKPGLGIVLSEKTKQAFPFVPGSGEFTNVPGKKLVE